MKLIGMMDAFCVFLPFVIIYMPQKVLQAQPISLFQIKPKPVLHCLDFPRSTIRYSFMMGSLFMHKPLIADRTHQNAKK